MSMQQLAVEVSEADRAALARVSALPLDGFRDEHLASQPRHALASESVPDARALARRLAVDPGARTRFRRSIAVSVSGPFRDPHQFELLEHELLPPLIAAPGRLRVWSAGCADGSALEPLAEILPRELGALLDADASSLYALDVTDPDGPLLLSGLPGLVWASGEADWTTAAADLPPQADDAGGNRNGAGDNAASGNSAVRR